MTYQLKNFLKDLCFEYDGSALMAVRELVPAVMQANNYIDPVQALVDVQKACIEIEQGNASYASAGMSLSLHVSCIPSMEFDAADLLSMIV
jgi:hypothetical protein